MKNISTQTMALIYRISEFNNVCCFCAENFKSNRLCKHTRSSLRGDATQRHNATPEVQMDIKMIKFEIVI